MKLYPKKLKSIEELQAEKQRLKAGAHLSMGDMVASDNKNQTTKGSSSKNSSDGLGLESILETITTLVYSGSPSKLVNTAVMVAVPVFEYFGIKAGQKAIKAVARDVVLGYAKWKALELGYKGVYSYLRSRMRRS